MSQSNVIFFFLFAAFVVFITQRGELPTYLGLLLASPKTGALVTDSGIGGSGVTTQDAVKLGAEVLPYVLV